MTDKLSLIISIAALALAGLSPIASAVVQLITRKMELDAEAQRRRAEFYDQHRAEVIERYITAVGEICKTESPQDLHDTVNPWVRSISMSIRLSGRSLMLSLRRLPSTIFRPRRKSSSSFARSYLTMKSVQKSSSSQTMPIKASHPA